LRHDIHVDGDVYRLRPVTEADSAFIVDLRGRNGKYLNRGAATPQAQAAWLQRYFERSGDFYFVIESAHGMTREGLIGLYDIEPSSGAAQWGRWVLQPGSNAAVESALLIYRCAFDLLSLTRVYCRTLEDNVQVVAFHDTCGLDRTVDSAIIDHNGHQRAAVEHTLARSAWPNLSARLERLASRFADTVARGA